MPRRLRPTPLEHVVDGHALRARLSAAALDPDTLSPREALEALYRLKGLDRG